MGILRFAQNDNGSVHQAVGLSAAWEQLYPGTVYRAALKIQDASENPDFCHPERSEGSPAPNSADRILRFAQNDTSE